MNVLLNETHDPELTSWLVSANRAGQDFPIQNLPFAVFRRAGSDESYRGGVAIGDRIVDLAALAAAGVFEGEAAVALAACAAPALNDFMALGQRAWSALRLSLSRALREGSPMADLVKPCLVPQSDAEFALPARIGDYTDFYASIHHATNVGKLFRPDNPLLPNYKWVPIGYHGRASSIGVSGQRFLRPCGQTMAPGAEHPSFGPSQRLDYEMEVGIFIGQGNPLGSHIALDRAEQHVFGLCLLNDWSARDIQAWEYQPLGPFLAKNFATTISPWIVTLEALAPFRVEWTRPVEDPQPLPYLASATLRREGAFDIQLEVWLQTERMQREGQAETRLSHTSFRHAYWSVSQMVTHHTVNGCGLQPGDLLGSGTMSGPAADEAGSLLELSAGGKQPLVLANGEERRFLQDGDTVTMRGYCERAGAARIGFGAAVGQVLPAGDRGSADA
ncbi:fumarylacetoacetase [Paludibacterium purpuratum]|uniref:fumarylacetoacetase n=1 Tax=Paludibacterium purpuratum TaxID=1144873 RepID=A0A4R7AZA2_9NEIS|nr:fumarylacetoacetase [Paludibacterium purpuratum]TDR73596.1 fumarylacetoacetate hydrolase [Paludibacterium purpuratum]